MPRISATLLPREAGRNHAWPPGASRPLGRRAGTLTHVPAPQVPKYQAIYSSLRQRILDGDLPAGAQLPAQQELADSFGVTLMTLRQAVAALEADGLVRAERGRGTFVADRPVDIGLANLSSFAQQMQSAGVEMQTEVLGVDTVATTDHPAAARALGRTSDADGVHSESPTVAGDLTLLTRRRSVGGLPLSLQRSYLDPAIGLGIDGAGLVDDSLYDTIEAATGWQVAEARESMTAVVLGPEDAALLAAEAGQPALLSIRTSINQFGVPFLFDEALLVGGRCVVTADRSADRLSLSYGLAPTRSGTPNSD